jgi:adenosine deaminase
MPSCRTPSPAVLEALIETMPKAELHLHIEGTLEPELMFELARRNGVPLRFQSVQDLRRAYAFENLQDFLNLYYEGAKVLLEERDFYDLVHCYLERCRQQNVRHVEVFFDPQTHTQRGVSMETVIKGLHRAFEEGQHFYGVTYRLILCFLRDLSAEDAMETLEAALPYKQWLTAVGLDSAEVGHPPGKFKAVFDRARNEGLLTVAHAGEEGPPAYIWEALDCLQVSRIDHGVRALEDPKLLAHLRASNIPLTVCPLSNIKLRVFPVIEAHTLQKLLNEGLCVTVNSDDPAYFGGYMTENYLAVQRALKLSADELRQLACNSFQGSFLPETEKQTHLAEVNRCFHALEAL